VYSSQLKNIAISASAGSGKTYQLTNRFIYLLHLTEEPDRIIALTFTRTAAGEFFHKIVEKLVQGAGDSTAAESLAGELGITADAARFHDLLRLLIQRMHRLNLQTLDSFFFRVVSAFALELGLSGSLRRGSYNTALVRAAAGLAPDGVELDLATPDGIPLYDGDAEEADGIPEAVTALKERIAGADGLLIATPEYNNGMPGVLKNTIDWLSRPPKDIGRVFRDRPVAVLGATPGGFGTVHAQTAWLPVLRALRMHPWFGGRLMLSRAGNAFAEDGSLTDEEQRKQLAAFVEGFAAFIRGSRQG